MSQVSPLDEFVKLILRNLEKNGYPAKAVAFPLETMYESASQKGFSFNKVRDILKQQGIHTELTENRVIFRPSAADENPDMTDLVAAAQHMIQNMSAEQRAQMAQMMQNMGPEELQKIQKQWEDMPEAEKLRLMEQMKKSGFV